MASHGETSTYALAGKIVRVIVEETGEYTGARAQMTLRDKITSALDILSLAAGSSPEAAGLIMDHFAEHFGLLDE